MSVIDYTADRRRGGYLEIRWDTAVDSNPKWVYVDGERVSTTPTDDADTGESYVSVRVSSDRTAAIDVLSDTIEPGTNTAVPTYLPIINWKSSIDAYRYYIYIDDILVRAIVADANKYLNKYQTVAHLSDGWHYLVVQARDIEGNTEDSVVKWFEVRTPGAPVEDITVTNGSGAGLYDITIDV